MIQEMLTDWKFWAFFLTIFVGLVNWLATHKLTTNHVAHLDIKLNTMDGKLDKISKEQNKQKTDIAVLKEKTKDL